MRGALVALAAPATVRDVAGVFKKRATNKWLGELGELLETLVALGHVMESQDGTYTTA